MISDSSTGIPDAERPDIPGHRLDQSHLLLELRNRLCKRWSSEYLHLQEREKWRSTTENFIIRRLVLLRDDRYFPTKWPLVKVIEVHPGPDGLLRTVIQTATFTLRRYITCLCPLILEQTPQQITSTCSNTRSEVLTFVRGTKAGGMFVASIPPQTHSYNFFLNNF